jgi:hypothetical protein
MEVSDCNKNEEPEVMEEKYYAWYSQKQFDTINNYNNNGKKKSPYIYYIDMSNNIIQVTEVSTNKQYPSLFNDVVNLGQVKEFHAALIEPIK